MDFVRTIGGFSVPRAARNGVFAAALAVAFAGASAERAEAGGKWIAGAIIGGLVAGAVIHHAYASQHRHGYAYKPVRKVRVVRRHYHHHHHHHYHHGFPLTIHVGHYHVHR